MRPFCAMVAVTRRCVRLWQRGWTHKESHTFQRYGQGSCMCRSVFAAASVLCLTVSRLLLPTKQLPTWSSGLWCCMNFLLGTLSAVSTFLSCSGHSCSCPQPHSIHLPCTHPAHSTHIAHPLLSRPFLQLFAVSLCAMPASGGRSSPALLGRLALPGCSLLMTPLFTKRLCATPLAEALLRPGRVAPGRTGCLSMDQARSLLPLEADDENVGTLLEWLLQRFGVQPGLLPEHCMARQAKVDIMLRGAYNA